MKYGEIPAPEDQQRIEVLEDPTKVLLSCYETYRKLVPAYQSNLKTPEAAYDIACKLLEGKEHLNPNADALLQGTSMHRTTEIDKDTSGIFLSAVLNKTKLDRLITGNAPTPYMGYRLALGKFLAVDSPGDLWCLGMRAEGGILVTYAYSDQFAKDATGGVQLHFGIGKDWKSSSERKAGLQVDWSESHIEPLSTKGLIHIVLGPRSRQWQVETAHVAGGAYVNAQFHKSVEGTINVALKNRKYSARWKNAAIRWAKNMENTLQSLRDLCSYVSLRRCNPLADGTHPVLGLRAFDWDGLQKTIKAEAKRLEDILP